MTSPLLWDTLKGWLGDESKPPYHIIHFDGHGGFYKQCPECHKRNDLDVDRCKCGKWIAKVAPSAYLAFEDEYVGSAEFGELVVVKAQHVKLVFLSACQSGWIQGKSIFSGMAPALIRGGVPAVVAMQFSMPTDDAVKFAQGFYEALAKKRPLVRAMDKARQKLCEDEPGKWKTWYIPTLYLRPLKDDKEGHLFPK